jgi:hypothetical protein
MEQVNHRVTKLRMGPHVSHVYRGRTEEALVMSCL